MIWLKMAQFILTEIFMLNYFFRDLFEQECFGVCVISFIFFKLLISFVFLFYLYIYSNNFFINLYHKKFVYTDYVNLAQLFFFYICFYCLQFVGVCISEAFFFKYLIIYVSSFLLILYLFLFYFLIKRAFIRFLPKIYLKIERTIFFFDCFYFFCFLVIILFLITLVTVFVFLYSSDYIADEFFLISFIEEYIPEYEELLKEIRKKK